MKDLSDYRKSYEKSELIETAIPDNPFELFDLWFQEAEAIGGTEEVNAMTIATIGKDGFPKSRIVLLKQLTPEGFIFFTNYESEKGKAIAENPNVCLSFFWPYAERQVIIKGTAEKTADEISDAYFQSRPFGSQLGALASHQSEIIENREVLEVKVKNLEEEFAGKVITRPAYWGGYLVKPYEIEFWQGRPNRLHDRIRFQYRENTWIKDRLSS
ncbi:MAG: pyridoxamine 5'-phosphate oxidase [Flavobacterium lindanitolerans]|uniref:pyridoxamine 5'-phosphate oxidase n=1 Tax=Flavobacterium lindanitolerans TaxID=428988 RepID=UPI001A58F50A|nr:pyridoxamine 5'-phosphate oxidase [Flavobacterium lindanitolerans]MBL7869193.1 pyridoxamine 5'-phosphate oxidase [Flavobacterium lindanitolerans]